MDENRPGYYAVIPASVRYDDKLKANAKILYGEISALIGSDGFCFASNAYFADLYKLTERTISDLISKLQEHGYIAMEFDRDKAGQITRRKIYLKESIPRGHPLEDFFYTPRKYFREGIEENFQYTNLSNTDIEKKTKEKEKALSKPKHVYSDEELHTVLVEWIKALPESAGWDRSSRNAIFFALVNFYAPRENKKQEPQRTKAGVTALCNKLSRQSGNNPRIMIDMVETATAAGWKSVYPPKSGNYAPPAEDASSGGDKIWL